MLFRRFQYNFSDFLSKSLQKSKLVVFVLYTLIACNLAIVNETKGRAMQNKRLPSKPTRSVHLTGFCSLHALKCFSCLSLSIVKICLCRLFFRDTTLKHIQVQLSQFPFDLKLSISIALF